MPKNMASRSGGQAKNFGQKVGVTKKILSSFAMTAYVITQTTYQNAKKFRKFRFSRKYAPGPSAKLCTKEEFYPSKGKKRHTKCTVPYTERTIAKKKISTATIKKWNVSYR